MKAIVIGASGGIGAALADALEARGAAVERLSRRAHPSLDLTDEASIAAAAAALVPRAPFDLLIVATGLLHTAATGPEKSWRQLDAVALGASFAVNAIGPMLVARHFLPLMQRRQPARLAFLSARVGSISDNRLGGWYGYRASKAALNQLVRTLAIELGRSHPLAICVALHPGTVDTALSAPFQRGVPPGRLFTPAYSAACLVDVIDRLTPEDSGELIDWAGEIIAP
ncbi:MAG: SDR family NAD(P)-dependent oxidoreductase [Sphingomicrobium sp.]